MNLTQEEMRALYPDLADRRAAFPDAVAPIKQNTVHADKKQILHEAWKRVTDDAEWLFTPEVKFHPDRRWRIDWFNAELMLGVEVEGVTNFGPAIGRHQSADGYEKDCEKYNAAAAMGIVVLRYSQRIIQADPHAVITQILEVASMLRMRKRGQ